MTKNLKLALSDKEFLTLEDAARLLSVSRTTLYRLRREGVLEIKTVGKKKYILRKSIDQLFNPAP
ncbi:MAG: helix-turn-helix domain-containing protein [Reichenbachiella sp.]